MTHDEILNMPAGREMDGFIEREIFGNATHRQSEASVIVFTINGEHFDLPHYSTDISAAWEITDKFYSFMVQRISDGKLYEAYAVKEKDGKNSDGFASENTAPLAICRAALLATMVNE